MSDYRAQSKKNQSIEFRDLIERVRERTDIVQIVGQRIPLNRHNKALCPFHEEKTPSFSVHPEGQYFHCFGCGIGGDVFRFLELYENKPFMEVLSELAAQAGIPLASLSLQDRQSLWEMRTIEDILAETARFYHQNLPPEVRDYLTKERGLSEETISRFQIGYADGNLWRYLLEERKFPADLCLKAGVLKRVGGDSIGDYFYHRIIFPNIRRGRVVHMSGRSLDGKDPKYLHLPGEIRYLYNEDALINREVYVSEGILDCLSAVQLGYPAVAILGASNFKPEYLPKFSRCETIYLCLDGDEAGREGSLRIGGLIGDRVRIIALPEGLDLNDYLKNHTREDFEGLVAFAKDIIQYELSLIPPDTNKIELPKRLEPILKKLAQMDKAKAEAYLSYEIKPRFKLKKEDIDGYRELILKHRKSEGETRNAHSFTPSTPDTEPIYTALFDGLVDLVEHNGSPAFLIKEGDSLAILPQIEREGNLYIPPPREQIPWLLPRGEEVLKLYELQRERDGELYDDLFAYHQEISELPGEEYYDLIVAWDFHTYLLEPVQYSPMICLFAVPERGKSRTGKGMIYVAYRGIHVESLRDAYLVRVANDLQASLFFDVKDIWAKAEKSGSEDILLHRFEKGAKVPRVLFPDRGAHRDIVYYDIFGPTIIATNEGVHHILETRAVQINMPETRKRFENDIVPEHALPLKERLIAFRARHLGETLPDVPKPANGRLGDILRPLQQIIRMVKPEREPAFLKLVQQIEAERLIEKTESLEAQILDILIRLREEVEQGVLPVKRIADAFNEGKAEKHQLSYHRMGRRLSAMGFQKSRTSDGASAIIWNDGIIGRLEEAYGLRKTSETSETSVSSAAGSGVSDVSDVSDVSRRMFRDDSTLPAGSGVSDVSDVSDVSRRMFRDDSTLPAERAEPPQHLPTIGDKVYLLKRDYKPRNPEPWEIRDIVEDPIDGPYALFKEMQPFRWPLKWCVVVESERRYPIPEEVWEKNKGVQPWPDIGDKVYLMKFDGTAYNPEPWEIVDIVDDLFARFREMEGPWPIDFCVIVERGAGAPLPERESPPAPQEKAQKAQNSGIEQEGASVMQSNEQESPDLPDIGDKVWLLGDDGKPLNPEPWEIWDIDEDSTGEPWAHFEQKTQWGGNQWPLKRCVIVGRSVPTVTPQPCLPDIGDKVWLLEQDGSPRNKLPWEIVDIAEMPNGEKYAQFKEISYWPLERCRLAAGIGDKVMLLNDDGTYYNEKPWVIDDIFSLSLYPCEEDEEDDEDAEKYAEFMETGDLWLLERCVVVERAKKPMHEERR